MGSAFSSSSSYLQYKNDFELVIRATKDLEHLLETGFGAPSGKNVGLHDKITAAQTSHGLSPGTVKHCDIWSRFNALPDRAHFARSYDGVERELKEKLRGESSGCIVC